MIKAFLFDFYNTLGHDRDPEDCVAARVLAEFGYLVDVAVVRRAQATASGWIDVPEGIDHSVHSDSYEQYLRYERSLHAPWLREVGVDPLPDAVFRRLFEEWDNPDRIVLFDDTLPVLARLRDAGYRLGVVSNWSWGLPEVLSRTGLTSLLELAITSARAGYRKPHPSIYSAALSRLALPAAEVLFVGDSPHADVVGPLAAGMRAVHINRFEAHPRHDQAPRIKALEELFDLPFILTAPGGAERPRHGGSA